MRQCNSCGGVKDRGHVCPTLSPAHVEIDGRSYIVPGEVACVFQAVSEERDELREAVRMFVEEMKSQDIMLPGEFDTMADLVSTNIGTD